LDLVGKSEEKPFNLDGQWVKWVMGFRFRCFPQLVKTCQKPMDFRWRGARPRGRPPCTWPAAWASRRSWPGFSIWAAEATSETVQVGGHGVMGSWGQP
jgi:hypothetical protein